MIEPEISIVVASHERPRGLESLLGGLEGQSLERDLWEVIVVHDSSGPETDRLLADHPLRVAGRLRALRLEPGTGPGPKRNAGVAAARAEAIAFTDDDCAPEPGWLEAGLRALRGADLVQGTVRPDPAAAIGPFDRYVGVGVEGGLYETANLFVDRALFERVGGFKSPFVSSADRPFGEDVWLGWRARRAGARTLFCAEAVVNHAVERQTAVPYVAERSRLRHFPPLVRRVPELRAQFLFGRRFLTRRSAAFDLAAAGVATALALRSRVPLLAATPYAVAVARRSRRFGWRAPGVALVDVTADALGAAALLAGSARARTLVL